MGCHSSRKDTGEDTRTLHHVEAAIRSAQAKFPLATVPLRRALTALAPFFPNGAMQISCFKKLCKNWGFPSDLLFGRGSPYQCFTQALIQNYTCLTASKLFFSMMLLSDAPVASKALLCDSLYPESIIQPDTAEWIIGELVEASCGIIPYLATTSVDMEELIEYIESLSDLKTAVITRCIRAMEQDGLPFDSFQLGTKFCSELQALFSASEVRQLAAEEAAVPSLQESCFSLDESLMKQSCTTPITARVEARKLDCSWDQQGMDFSQISCDSQEFDGSSLDSLISAVSPRHC